MGYAGQFAIELLEVVKDRCRGGKIGFDRLEFSVALALRDHYENIVSGRKILEHARLIKSVDEIKAMRCSIAACEAAMAEMQAVFEPGISESELWSHLHKGNIARGGEWIETRLLASGPRTNPWMQEASARVIQEGDLLAFDTDLIGPYGICADISRTWLCGDRPATAEQKELFGLALEHITENAALLKPGVSFADLSHLGHQLPGEYLPQRYAMKMHGVGLCDEFPAIYYPPDVIDGAFDYETAAGMVLCVEAYFGKVGGREGVKLENQVLITDTGFEVLSKFPFEAALLPE